MKIKKHYTLALTDAERAMLLNSADSINGPVSEQDFIDTINDLLDIAFEMGRMIGDDDV